MEVGQAHWDVLLSQGRGFPVNNYFNLDINRGDLEIDKGHNAVAVLVNEGSFTNSSGGAACVNYVNTVTSCAVTGFLD